LIAWGLADLEGLPLPQLASAWRWQTNATAGEGHFPSSRRNAGGGGGGRPRAILKTFFLLVSLGPSLFFFWGKIDPAPSRQAVITGTFFPIILPGETQARKIALSVLEEQRLGTRHGRGSLPFSLTSPSGNEDYSVFLSGHPRMAMIICPQGCLEDWNCESSDSTSLGLGQPGGMEQKAEC
jgi:hypothetical protein